MKLSKTTLKGHALAGFCAIVWGVTFVISKHLLVYYSPVQLMFMRFVIAYITLCILHPHWERPTLREELLYFFMGLTGCTLYFWTENTSLTLTYAANVSTIVALAPILTAILAHCFSNGRNKLNRWIWIGFVIAMSGVILVVFNGTFVLRLNPKGDLLAVATALQWAIFSVLQEHALKKRISLYITRKVMFYGIVTALPLFLASIRTGFSFAPLLTVPNALGLLFLAVVGSALCYLAWCSAEKLLGVVVTSNYIYVIPFITLFFGAVFLNEPISPLGAAGAVLTIAGVWAASRKPAS